MAITVLLNDGLLGYFLKYLNFLDDLYLTDDLFLYLYRYLYLT